MEQRLPLGNDDDYQEAVQDIADSKFEERAKERGSNILGWRIRRLALQPFLPHHATGRLSSNLSQGNLHTGFGSPSDVRQSNTSAGMTPENKEILLLTKSPKQMLRLGSTHVRACKSCLNILLRLATRPCQVTLLGCLVQRGVPHMVIEQKRLRLDSGISPWSQPVGSQADGRPQDTGIVIPDFQASEENVRLQTLLAAAEVHSQYQRSQPGHGERETRNQSIPQLGPSTRSVPTGGNLFYPDRNPSSLSSNTMYPGSMTSQVQDWQLSQQSTGQTLPLPQPGDTDAWAGTENVIGEQTLLLPQSENMDAWVETGGQTLPLPQPGDTDAWAGTENVIGEQTLLLPQSENMDAWVETEHAMDEMPTWTQS